MLLSVNQIRMFICEAVFLNAVAHLRILTLNAFKIDQHISHTITITALVSLDAMGNEIVTEDSAKLSI